MLCIDSCRNPDPGTTLTTDRSATAQRHGDLVPFENLLVRHPWVAAARSVDRPETGGLLIAPTTAGLRAYRCTGRAGIAAAWAGHVGAPMPRHWRLVEALPRARDEEGAELAEAILREPLPQQPVEEGLASGVDGEIRYDLRVPLELAIFRSHFPVAPIVPGVEQIRWAVIFSQRHFDLPSQFAGLDMLRFRRVMQPGSDLQLTLRSVAGSGTLYFGFRSARGPDHPMISDGRILFRDAGAV